MVVLVEFWPRTKSPETSQVVSVDVSDREWIRFRSTRVGVRIPVTHRSMPLINSFAANTAEVSVKEWIVLREMLLVFEPKLLLKLTPMPPTTGALLPKPAELPALLL